MAPSRFGSSRALASSSRWGRCGLEFHATVNDLAGLKLWQQLLDTINRHGEPDSDIAAVGMARPAGLGPREPKARLTLSLTLRVHFVLSFLPHPTREPEISPVLRLSEAARNIDFHQKGLLSDQIGVGMAAILLGTYLHAPFAADVSVAMSDPAWPIDLQYDTSPDYLFFDTPQTSLFVVECKGTQTTRYRLSSNCGVERSKCRLWCSPTGAGRRPLSSRRASPKVELESFCSIRQEMMILMTNLAPVPDELGMADRGR